MKPPIRNKPYPVGLLLKGKNCLVAGGGAVGARKAATLLEHGAVVTVVSPEICPDLQSLLDKGKIVHISKLYSSNDIENMSLVIAATNNKEINTTISNDARKKRVLVNVVDDEELSDFILPAYFCRGSLVVTVATSGQSPALARKLKEKLEEEFGPEYSTLVDIIGHVRHQLKLEGKNPPYSAWQEALDIESLLGFIKQGQAKRAEDYITTKITRATGLNCD